MLSGILQTEGVSFENLGIQAGKHTIIGNKSDYYQYGKVAILGFHSNRYLCMGKKGVIYTRVCSFITKMLKLLQGKATFFALLGKY